MCLDAAMEQDHRQVARDTFDRIMRVPDAIVATTVVLFLGVPFFMMLDATTTGRTQHTEIVFVTGLAIAAVVLIPVYFVLRLIIAAVIAAITVGRAAGHRAVQQQIHHSISSAQL